jgi:hypothetical protein
VERSTRYSDSLQSKRFETDGILTETRRMSENPTPDEKEFAKQIDDEIKARFHFELKSRLKEETLEEVQDAYKLVMPATDSKGFKDAACHSRLNRTW